MLGPEEAGRLRDQSPYTYFGFEKPGGKKVQTEKVGAEQVHKTGTDREYLLQKG